MFEPAFSGGFQKLLRAKPSWKQRRTSRAFYAAVGGHIDADGTCLAMPFMQLAHCRVLVVK
jgi:hypothetical protein